MGIKVKHDGNATATAFASAQGGMGKRAQQDAASMAQTMQSAANNGNQQLRGASAPGATPGRSNAPLTHAPLTSAPNPPIIPGLYGSTRSGVGSRVAPSSGVGAPQRKGLEMVTTPAKMGLFSGGPNTLSGFDRTKDAAYQTRENGYRPIVGGDGGYARRIPDSMKSAAYVPTADDKAAELDKQLAVKDKYAMLAEERNLAANKEMANLNADLKGKIYRNQMLVDLQRYTGQKRADQAMHPDMVTIQNAASNSNKNAQRMITFLSRGGSVSEQNAEHASDKVWGSTDTSGSSRVQTSQTPQQGQAPSYDYGKMYEGGGHYYGSGGSVDSGTTDQSADSGGSFDSVGEALQNK